MQFLSEPSGGSDLAGALTTAARDGDEWVLNGSKVWTTGAWWADWAICLARTDWDVPKHQGLTVFALPIHQDGIVVRQIEMLNGAMDFCQEYLTDVRVPDSCRIGEVNGGWTVASRLLFHERMQHSSPYVTNPAGAHGVAADASPVRIARDAGRLTDPVARDLVGEARVLQLASNALQQPGHRRRAVRRADARLGRRRPHALLAAKPSGRPRSGTRSPTTSRRPGRMRTVGGRDRRRST